MNGKKDFVRHVSAEGRVQTPPSPIMSSEEISQSSVEISKNVEDIKAMIDQAFLDSLSGDDPSKALIELIKPLIASEAVLEDPGLQLYKKADTRDPVAKQPGLEMLEQEAKKTEFINLVLTRAVNSLEEDVKAKDRAEKARNQSGSRRIRPGGR